MRATSCTSTGRWAPADALKLNPAGSSPRSRLSSSHAYRSASYGHRHGLSAPESCVCHSRARVDALQNGSRRSARDLKEVPKMVHLGNATGPAASRSFLSTRLGT